MFPLVKTAYAATNPVIDGIIAKLATQILNPLIALAFAVATVVLFWGLFQLIKGGDDPDARKLGHQHILWGIVGMAIMVSAYGILNFIFSTLTSIQAGN